MIALDLGPLPLLLWAPGWAVLLPPGAGLPFRPDQKVKLDKTEATEMGLLLYSQDGQKAGPDLRYRPKLPANHGVGRPVAVGTIA